MKPTTDYDFQYKEKQKDIFDFRIIQSASAENPSLRVVFGQYPLNKEYRNVKEVGEKKESYALVWLGLTAGAIAMTINGSDDYELQQEDNGDTSRFYAKRSLGVLLGMFSAAGLYGDLKKRWTSTSRYKTQTVNVEDERDFTPISKTEISVTSSNAKKSLDLVTDQDGCIKIDLSEMLDLETVKHDIRLICKAKEFSNVSEIISISSTFFTDLHNYYASIRPPELYIVARLDDSNSWAPNQLIDGAEIADLVILVENRGDGNALDVKLAAESNNPNIELKQIADLGTILPKEKVERRISFRTPIDISDGQAVFNIKAKEKRKFDARPVQLQVPIRHLIKPYLSFNGFLLNDGALGQASGNNNGQVENGVTIEVSAFIKNTGRGTAVNTTVILTSASAGAFITSGKAYLGNILPGETRQARMVIVVPRIFTGNQLLLSFTAHDTIGACKIVKEHILPLNKRSPLLSISSRFLNEQGVQVEQVHNGSEYNLEITVQNDGELDAKNITAQASSSQVSVLSPIATNIGNLPPAAKSIPIRFPFELVRNYQAGSPQFILRLTQNDFADITKTFSIPIVTKTPNLYIKESISTTDGNQDISQGENVFIEFAVENRGNLDAESVMVELDLKHSGIDVEKRILALNKIPASSSSSPRRFNFWVKPGAEPGPVAATLRISQADGFSGIDKAFNLDIKPMDPAKIIVSSFDNTSAGNVNGGSAFRTNVAPLVGLSAANVSYDNKTYDPIVKLEIMIQDDKPILSIEPEIRVNGKLQSKEIGLRSIEMKDREIKETDRKIHLYRQAELVQGLNNIEVRVFDSDNETGYDKKQIELIIRRSEAFALVIGVRNYQNIGVDPLKYAAADAQSFYDFLRTPQGGELENDHIRLLLNSEATRKNILNGMEWLAGRCFENDLVIIYMAMHGLVDQQGEFYFLGHDSDPNNLFVSGIKKSEIEFIHQRLKSNKIVLFADACHSGSLGENPQIAMRSIRASIANRLLGEIAKARNGLAIFMSAQAAEYSRESSTQVRQS